MLGHFVFKTYDEDKLTMYWLVWQVVSFFQCVSVVFLSFHIFALVFRFDKGIYVSG